MIFLAAEKCAASGATTWQDVVLFAIIAAAGCFVAWVMFR